MGGSIVAEVRGRRTRQGRRMGGPPEVEALAAEVGYKVAVYRETKSRERYRKLVDYGDGTPLNAGIFWTFCGVSGVPGVRQRKWGQQCKGYWTMHKTGSNGRKKCRTGRGDRSYQGMASAYIGHSARWTEQAGKQRRMRCAEHSWKGIWRGPQSRGGHGRSCRMQEPRHGSSTWTRCARGRYGEEHVKLGVGRKTRDAERQCTGNGDRRGYIERWRRSVKESGRQQRCCGAEEEGDSTTCCGPGKERKQRQWRRQRKGTGKSRRARRECSWRWSRKKKARGRGVDKEDRRRSKCGRMCTKYTSRRGVQGGGTRDKRVP